MASQNDHLKVFLEQWHAGKGIVSHTSGSTGIPKEIVLSHNHIVRSASRTNRFFGITKKSRLHSAVSFEFIGGKMMVARSLVAGCNLTFSEPSLTPDFPEGNSEVSLMSVVPAQMPFILENADKFSHVKAFLLGGSAINNLLWQRIVASGLNCWESYGMTETASHVALRRIAGSASFRPRFVPLPGINIVTDFEDCIHITDGDVTVATNDLAVLYPDGSFEVKGRRDDVIISGGLKIIPQEVENVLRPYIGALMKDFCIVGVADEIWTSRLVMLAVPPAASRPGGTEINMASLQSCIDAIPYDILERRKRPKEIRFVSALPMTPSGKIKRN